MEICEATTGATVLVVEDLGLPAALSGDGKRLATFHGLRNLVQLWDTASGKRLAVLKRQAQDTSVFVIALSHDGRRLAEVNPPEVAIYDTASHKEWLRFKPGIDCVAAAFTPDGKRLATGGDTGIITLWDAATGQEVLTLRGHSGAISRLTFSADGRFLASSSKDGSVKLWEAAP